MALRVCTKFRPEKPRVALAAYGQKSLVTTVAVDGEREGEGRKDKGWGPQFPGSCYGRGEDVLQPARKSEATEKLENGCGGQSELWPRSEPPWSVRILSGRKRKEW